MLQTRTPGSGCCCAMRDGRRLNVPWGTSVPLVPFSWNIRLTWKLLAAIVALFVHESQMFHDNFQIMEQMLEYWCWRHLREPRDGRGATPGRTGPNGCHGGLSLALRTVFT